MPHRLPHPPPDVTAFAGPIQPGRRQWLCSSAALLLPAAGMTAPTTQAASTTTMQPRPLIFPADHGAHPAQRTEWWYVTGWLAEPDRPDVPRHGFQITFFRSRGDVAADHPSAFAARQLVLAHAALTDLAGARLLHDQRIARAGFGLAEAAEGDTEVRLRDWSLRRRADDIYQARVQADDPAGFMLDLTLQPPAPPLLQGTEGWSRKGPAPPQASFYYSRPQLQVNGQLQHAGRTQAVSGRAWLDHEWSESILAADAVGWDWIGINLLGGGALTAFRLRRADGSALWAGGSWQAAGQRTARSFTPDEVRFTPQRRWRSPASGTSYPVEWLIETPAGSHRVRALLDAQELDSRRSTGSIYWEGLSELLDTAGRRVGLGYLELTGYAAAMQL